MCSTLFGVFLGKTNQRYVSKKKKIKRRLLEYVWGAQCRVIWSILKPSLLYASSFNFAELIDETPPAKRTFSRRETRSPVQHGAFNIGHHYYHCRLHAWACIRPRASLAKSHSINYRETLSKKLNNFWLVRHLFFNTCLKWDRYNK